MGLVDKLYSAKRSRDQQSAMDAVFDLLARDNADADRKQQDEVYISRYAVVVVSWGIQREEACRKHEHARHALEEAGMLVNDCGISQQTNEVIGGIEGTLVIPARKNGGFSGIVGMASRSGCNSVPRGGRLVSDLPV